MKMQRCVKESFTVIGKEGSTMDGAGFIGRLWEEANTHFLEIAHLVKRDENGTPVGFWGAMSDMSGSFKPWEQGFSVGLYLAGAECEDRAVPPEGWVKWIIPGYEYLQVENESESTFHEAVRWMQENGLELAGAAHDFTCPKTGKGYIFLPIRRL